MKGRQGEYGTLETGNHLMGRSSRKSTVPLAVAGRIAGPLSAWGPDVRAFAWVVEQALEK
jgi:hypothetical protein